MINGVLPMGLTSVSPRGYKDKHYTLSSIILGGHLVTKFWWKNKPGIFFWEVINRGAVKTLTLFTKPLIVDRLILKKDGWLFELDLTIKINQMWVNIPHMDPVGFKPSLKLTALGGGFKHFLEIFHPELRGNDPIWRAYFSNGLKTATSNSSSPLKMGPNLPQEEMNHLPKLPIFRG